MVFFIVYGTPFNYAISTNYTIKDTQCWCMKFGMRDACFSIILWVTHRKSAFSEVDLTFWHPIHLEIHISTIIAVLIMK